MLRHLAPAFVLASLTVGCANQQTLANGARYAEAYAKVGSAVDEALMLSIIAQRRRVMTNQLGLEPSDSDKELAVELACASAGNDAARVAFSSGNLDRYQAAIEALAKAPKGSVAELVGGLRKALPTADGVQQSYDDFRVKEAARRQACTDFARASLATPFELAGFAGVSITAVLGIVKRILTVIESERRAAAFKRLVIDLDVPIAANITALEKDLSAVLLSISQEALVSAALGVSSTPSSGAEPLQRVGSTVLALASFDKAWALFSGFYTPAEGGENVFKSLSQAHQKIVTQARTGRVTGAAAIDDLLAALELLAKINEDLEKL
jgi:hypothetical protein